MNQRLLCIGPDSLFDGLAVAFDCTSVSSFEKAVLGPAAPSWDAVVLRHDVAQANICLMLEAGMRAPIIVFGGSLSPQQERNLMELGALACLPCDSPGVAEVEKLLGFTNCGDAHHSRRAEPWRDLLIGESRGMLRVMEIIRLVAPRRSTVLITGETGTGKEVVARAVHMASDRRDKPMVSINCAAIPESLMEAELFGHTKGAFTGAAASKPGKFEQADGGTIFLDEIAELPLELQSKLLRVLQEREVQRLGGTETIKVDVRVIAAANVDLEKAVAEKRFREDLYYRLNVVPVPLPPVRERTGDVPLLVRHFLHRTCREEGGPLKQVSDETMRGLAAYPWPGNVRQIQHAVEMAVALSGDRTALYLDDFPAPSSRKPVSRSGPLAVVPPEGLDFDAFIGSIELSLLSQALERTRGNKGRAADLLGLKRTTLLAKLKAFGWEPEEPLSSHVFAEIG
jgi:transcriptional regulator with PAS, ATPase and Fis domain